MRNIFLAAVCAAVILGCANRPAAPDEAVVQPNPNLVLQGIPAVPQSLVREVEKYTDFRGHGFVDWHPTRREMLVWHRKAGANTAQLFSLAGPLAEAQQLTDFADPVREASYEPFDGRYIVFERSSGGNEAGQLYRLDLADRQVTLLTDPNERHDMLGWLHGQSRLFVMSTPLDKTAQGGSRAEIGQTLTLLDPARPSERRTVAQLAGTGWYPGGVSWDDRQLALTRYISANESQVWLLDLASGRLTQVLPAAGATARAVHMAGAWARDGSGFYVLSDRDGEFRELMFRRSADGGLVSLTREVPWDVDGGSLSADQGLLAARVNVDGRNELRLFEAASRRQRPLAGMPAGSIGASEFHRHLPELAFNINSSAGPSQVHTLDPRSGKVEAWTRPYAPPEVDMAAFGEQTIVRWKSFDGREISGLLSRPPARFAGRRPVLIAIHGGPEGQATMGFLGRTNHFIQDLGIAVIQPNVRGSTGYGKTFLTLDNGMLREDSVKDIGALLDWIATQPDLDPSRIVVTGGSYGGYMSLAVATHYADRIAGAIDVVGISNFVSFLRNTESYRRDLRRVEYGDEREPAMHDFLQRISPLTNARKITKPLFVVQGKNDPRVPYTEAEQIVAQVRSNGTPVWYLRAENEGHGFARKENADFEFYATVLFLRRTLALK